MKTCKWKKKVTGHMLQWRIRKKKLTRKQRRTSKKKNLWISLESKPEI